MSRKVDLQDVDSWSEDDTRYVAQFPWMVKEAGLTEGEIVQMLGPVSDNYDDMSNDELRAELADRAEKGGYEPDVSGNKATLKARLREQDADDTEDA